jgi:ubiquinone/menaquinone biosynthesis C-methylase UbiE
MDDIERLRREYADRKQRFAGQDTYSLFNPANLFMIQQRQRVVLSILRKYGFADFHDRKVFEMGCGNGGILAEYLTFGVFPSNIFGVDLLFDRLEHAHQILPGAALANANGQSLPFPSASFDLVLQSTAISSILDPVIREDVSTEMLRVLKPQGLILSYDFWLNPSNPQTRGVRPSEIRQLFPNCSYEFHRITLAPPVVRRLISVSWGVCLFLERLKILNTHYLVAIRKNRLNS